MKADVQPRLAVVVAWQSWETRRSAEASERAVDAAERAVAAADEGLDLSRQQVAEAVRTRIDAATPVITVSAPAEPEWPPLEPSGYLGGEPQPIRQGMEPRTWHMPRDRAQEITVRTPVSIKNCSDVMVTVGVDELTDGAGQRAGHSLDLASGEQRDLYFAFTRTIEAWVAIYQQRTAGHGGDYGLGSSGTSTPPTAVLWTVGSCTWPAPRLSQCPTLMARGD